MRGKSRFNKALLFILGLVSLTGCVHLPPPATAEQIKSLETALTKLRPSVEGKEAAIVAPLAYDYPRELARKYRLVRPPLWHNLLINLGLKKRGLCYHWAEDMATKLQSLNLESLETHWGVSRAGTFREHNTVVITAWNQPFATGIVLDPWRHSGRLYWTTVTNDAYVWIEGDLSLQPAAENLPTKPSSR